MKHSSKGNFTVYEESDICSLDEYSETLGEELEDKLEEVEQEIEESAYDDTEVQNEITALQTENTRLKATLPTTTGEGENITLDKTAELEFIQPPLPRGNSEQATRQGYNVLNPTLETKTTNGVTCTNNGDGTYTLNGTATASTNFQLFTTSPTISAETYKLVGCKNGSYSTYSLRAYNSATSTLKVDIGSGVTFTTTENLAFQFFIDIANGTTFNNVIFKPMLTTNTSLTYDDYEQYGAMPSPEFESPITNVTGDVEVLVQNKNKLSSTAEFSTISNGMNFTGDGKGTYKMFGTSTANTAIVTNNLQKAYTIKSGDYLHLKNNATGSISVIFYNDNTQVFAVGMSPTNRIYDLSSYVGSTINKIGLYCNSGVTTDLTLTPMILNNVNTDTTYTPHKEQTYTFPLGTQRMYLGDYLADDGIHHVRKQKVFDGSSGEYWTLGNVIENTTGLYITDETVAFNTENKIIVLSDNFKENTPSQIIDNAVVGICSRRGTGRGIYVRVPNSIAMTVADFKTWLSTHNTTVEYELATEEITPYTTEQQQAYDEIKQAISYEEQTNISGSSDESNPLFSVEAYQSTKLILENIDSRLTIVES